MDYDRLRELQEKFEENPRRYFAPLANEYRKGGQPKRAIEICRTHLAQMPGHMSGQIVFGQSLFEAGEYDEARQVFERALVLDPENLIALRSLGDMELQAGNTSEARNWYTRLLEADPKDTSVIALVSEIDALADATPVKATPAIPGIDTDGGDQQIPFLEPPPSESAAASPYDSTTSTAASASSDATATDSSAAAPSIPAPSAEVASSAPAEVTPPMPTEVAPPMPSELATAASTPASVAPPMPSEMAVSEARETAVESTEPPAAPEPIRAESAAAEPPAVERQEIASRHEPAAAEPLGLERHYPVPSNSEDVAESMGVTGEPEPLVSQRQDVGNPLDSWAPSPEPVEAEAPAAGEVPAEKGGERTFSGASAEPFVNETMAQLYLKQGYRQLALQVYHRLAEARPNDQALRDRIAEIEAADAAAESAAAQPEARREERSVEQPVPDRPTPRSPSIETPTPSRGGDSEETPGFDRAPVDSPPTSAPRESDSVEAPSRGGPRAEPEGISARQPSIREFFATLGRRRPPRTAASGRPMNAQSADLVSSLPAAPPGPSLDNVFAGAEVSPADSRAASRLAGAFSSGGTSSRSGTTPQTPSMPTPRVNPRLQTQESEEDVAKFRAWLDGLTGE